MPLRLLLIIPILLLATFNIQANERISLEEDIIEWQKKNPMPEAGKKVSQSALTDLLATGIEGNAPKVGSKLPDAEFKNHLGKTVKLSEIIGDQSAIVTFYRGGWCPYCNLQLRAYQKRLEDFKKLNAKLIAISPETPDNSLSTKQKLTLDFTVLSDTNNSYARKNGIVFKLNDDLQKLYKKFGIDLSKNQGNEAWELPLAATFVVDKNLKIHHAFVKADYTKREEPATLINALVKIMK